MLARNARVSYPHTATGGCDTAGSGDGSVDGDGDGADGGSGSADDVDDDGYDAGDVDDDDYWSWLDDVDSSTIVGGTLPTIRE